MALNFTNILDSLPNVLCQTVGSYLDPFSLSATACCSKDINHKIKDLAHKVMRDFFSKNVSSSALEITDFETLWKVKFVKTKYLPKVIQCALNSNLYLKILPKPNILFDEMESYNSSMVTFLRPDNTISVVILYYQHCLTTNSTEWIERKITIFHNHYCTTTSVGYKDNKLINRILKWLFNTRSIHSANGIFPDQRDLFQKLASGSIHKTTGFPLMICESYSGKLDNYHFIKNNEEREKHFKIKKF